MSFRWPEIKLPGSTKRKPEDSIELRAWVLAAVLVGEAAVLTSGYFGAVTSVLVPFLTVVAFVVSYQRRRERNIILKVMLAFGALAALAMFFREVLSSLYDTRVPLARLFLWVQVIHAFDLPARKDLSYSLVSALILVAVGAVLSTSLWYGVFVLAFLLCAIGAMAQMNLSEARQRAGLRASRSRGLVVGTVVPCFFAVVAVGLVCFSLLPQRQAMNLTTDNLQGGKVFGFMAKRLGEAAGPAAATAGTLMRGVARLDPASIIIVGLLVGGAYLAFFYTRKFVAHRNRKTVMVRPIKVSDARLYSRYKKITTAIEEMGIVRESQETPEQYARRAARALDEPGINRLGEIYLYARFRNAVPSTLVEEFDRLEPQTLAAIERLQETQTVSNSASSD